MTASKITNDNNWPELPGNRERGLDVFNPASGEVWRGIDNRTTRQSPGEVAGDMPFNSKGVEFTMAAAR